ncbi:transcriptional repressor [candidate division LCP-89 bacterium B3_LCP]|uniref:Ferric uptake regulation protein n=1 Tax=candidate division LCP-89 bacterium B3_LCP TaxID=2012998 RepID=A0A532V5K3_UNCL8|nr:MAG: transcriptional repressor [candidate division LCP-89 bacterium B3_LCP]
MEEKKFVNYLRRTGLKNTQARREVLQEVFRCHHHFDADDLYLRLKNRRAGVSRATVYRTLALLVESDLVRKMDLGEGRSTFEHVLGHPHHDHLVCVRCGSILEFRNSAIEDLQQKVCSEFDFKMLSHTQQIYGVCSKCQEKDDLGG